jgi:hypothetical protein
MIDKIRWMVRTVVAATGDGRKAALHEGQRISQGARLGSSRGTGEGSGPPPTLP